MAVQRSRVLHLITRLDPGGSAENTLLSAERVDPDRFDSYVWSGHGFEGSNVLDRARERIGDRLEVVPSLVRPIRPFRDLAAVSSLVRRFRFTRPDILHLHSAKAGAVGRVAARIARLTCPVVYTPHGHVFSGYGGSTASRLFTMIERVLAASTDVIVGLTPDEVRAFDSNGARPLRSFEVIPSGVPIEPYEAGARERKRVRTGLGVDGSTPLIGYVGRLTHVKGPDLFLEAARSIHAERPDVRFLIVGDGEMWEELTSRAGTSSIRDAVQWVGWRDDVPQLMGALDLLLLTSRNEGQGRVVVEAGAAGVPTVALNSGGVGEVIRPGVTGMLVAAGDIEALTKAVGMLLDDPARRKSMGEAAQARSRSQYSVDVMIHKLEQLYSRLLS
jgi:glycosyltransferase involved in cell wall biosynthesis